MELTFLGTGAAFAGDAFNAGYILDRRVLVDAGAPVHVLIHQTGHRIADIEAAVITHQHADHTFGLPYVMATRAIEAPDAPPFTIAGPTGFEAYINNLFQLAWGDHLRNLVWERLQPRFVDFQPGEEHEVAGFTVHAEEMRHVPDIPCLGYNFRRQGISFGFSGDTTECPGLGALVEMSDSMLMEMTATLEGDPSHMSISQARAIVAANPGKRFFLTHLNRRKLDYVEHGEVEGADRAEDLTTVELLPGG
ncbi:MAG TPA: MBL fold metallo-hydrolase [Candidatus Dormibacteraeota bacterium]|nr:MBL fold metallo-hydrolase [Candidatus Dormibacteraeota bacterium]